MLSRKKVIEVLKRETSYLKSNFGVRRIAIFGSVARNAPAKNSDVDIMVDLDKTLGLDFFDLADYLEKTLGRKVDILTPEGLRSIRIKEVGRRIKRSLLYV